MSCCLEAVHSGSRVSTYTGENLDPPTIPILCKAGTYNPGTKLMEVWNYSYHTWYVHYLVDDVDRFVREYYTGDVNRRIGQMLQAEQYMAI